MLNKNIEVFVIYMTFLLKLAIYPTKKIQIALFIVVEVKILAKYTDFSNVFLKKKALILLKITNLNQYAISCKKVSIHFLGQFPVQA